MSVEEPRQQALSLAMETMAELVEFWGFKGSLGRIWTLLYLSNEPMAADTIAEDTRLSTGAVSMALTELMQWGLVSRDPLTPERKRHYRAETDVWAIVRRIIRQRELRLIERAVDRFGQAVELLEAAQIQHPHDTHLPFMLTRLKKLLDLARIGYRLVEKLAEVGRFSLLPIKGTLGALERS